MKKITLFLLLGFIINANIAFGSDQFSSTLAYGSKNKVEVKKLQDFLSSEGLFSTSSTGTFGAITLKAVKAFQKREGIATTGFFGIKTKQRANEITELKQTATVSTTTTDNTYANQIVQNTVTPIIPDLCINIEGVQSVIPTGMTATYGVCAYPQQPTQTNNTNSSNNSSSNNQSTTTTQNNSNNQQQNNQNSNPTPEIPTVPMIMATTGTTGSLMHANNLSVARFNLVNSSSNPSLYWKRIILDVTKQGHISATDFVLYDSSNTLVPATLTVTNTSGDVGGDGYATAKIVITANSEQEMPAGTATSYTLRANIGGSPVSGDFVAVGANSATISSASNYSSISPSTVFTWTDRSASSHSESTNDWYSGLSGDFIYNVSSL